jgi:hypothetical protein
MLQYNIINNAFSLAATQCIHHFLLHAVKVCKIGSVVFLQRRSFIGLCNETIQLLCPNSQQTNVLASTCKAENCDNESASGFLRERLSQELTVQRLTALWSAMDVRREARKISPEENTARDELQKVGTN